MDRKLIGDGPHWFDMDEGNFIDLRTAPQTGVAWVDRTGRNIWIDGIHHTAKGNYVLNFAWSADPGATRKFRQIEVTEVVTILGHFGRLNEDTLRGLSSLEI